MQTLFIGQNIIELQATASTNNYTTELLRHSVIPEGSIVLTNNQFEGRGQRGNEWKSEPGKNLTFTLVLHPTFIEVSKQFCLTKLISLSVLEFLKEKFCTNAQVKWPNDVLIKDKKICGILIENNVRNTHLQSSLIGIGLNINQEFFGEIDSKTTSLIREREKEFDLLVCLEKLCDIIEYRYLMLKKNTTVFDTEYLDNLFQFGQLKRYKIENEIIEAVIGGVDDSGRLILETKQSEVIVCGFKEVEFV